MRNPSVDEPAPLSQDEPTVIEPAAADPTVAEPVVEPNPGTATEVQPPLADDGAETAAPAATPASAATPPAKKKSRFGFLKELPALLLVAFVLALIIKTFLVQAFYIPSGSMENTLLIGDRVLVNKVTYHSPRPAARRHHRVRRPAPRCRAAPFVALGLLALADRGPRRVEQPRQGLHQAGHRAAG